MPLDGLNHEEHESLCRRCGQSCYFAIPLNGQQVIIDGLHCKFLGERDEQGRQECTVYENRFEAAPWCFTFEEALEGGFLSWDCPYTREMPDYSGKRGLPEPMERLLGPEIKQVFLKVGVPIGVSRTGLADFLARHGGGTFRFEPHADGLRLMIIEVDDQTAQVQPSDDS